MRKMCLALATGLLALLLVGCSMASPVQPPRYEGDPTEPPAPTEAPAPAAASAQTPTPEPSPEPTPEPTPAPTPAPTEWDVLAEGPEEILALAQIPGLQRVNAMGSREYAALVQLQQLLPDCDVQWQVPLQGTNYPKDTEQLVLRSTEGLEEAMVGLPALRRVDLTACAPDQELMERLYDAYPQVDFLWYVHFGVELLRTWTVRSDITCFSTLWTGDESYRYTENDYYPLLRFCRHLRALDLGHSDICDVSLIGGLKELQVLILADNPRITDITSFANLENLRYLELFMCYNIQDFTCFYSMHKMEDMNLSYCRYLDFIDFLDGMPDFKRGWFRNTQISYEMIQPYKESREDVTFMLASPKEDLSSIIYGWRETDRCRAIRNAFSHWENVKEYRSWDDIEYYS